MKLSSYALGEWVAGTGEGRGVHNAVSGELIGTVDATGLDFGAMLDYGRRQGGEALRKMTFHERALMLKQLALYLMARKEALYELNYATGATRKDGWIDIDGGIGTFFVYSGKGRRDFPNERFYVDGPPENISRYGTFMGRHICVPLEGCAVHINAFNFPVWGMLEKLAPTFLAGMPAIVKPATASSYLTRAAAEMMIGSGILPEGALQIICGGVGDLFEHLMEQDVVTFTGSATTGRKLKAHPNIIGNSVRFNMEADSLNMCMLGPDVTPEMPEFALFCDEVVREMTVKAGQKCTAIRRTIVPEDRAPAVIEALSERLAQVRLGNPVHAETGMGALVSRAQFDDVAARVDDLCKAGELVYGGLAAYDVLDGDKDKGAFFPSTLLYCDQPLARREPHDIEAFGPVNTVMPYGDLGEAIELAKMGRGSLCGSFFSADEGHARDVVLGTAAWHGRIMVLDRHSARESTGHGSPLPHLVHGGPGRAGGGEEMGGPRAVMHYMQRTAIQGSPDMLTAVTNEWMKGARQPEDRVHPFRKYFEELEIGETLVTARRTVTEADIVNFGCMSGDHFYAHFDKIAAAKSPIFGERVAHGYFIISAAAGLFVDAAPGPVLANYGLENLRFIEPVKIGDTIQVKLTCMRKTKKYKKEEDDIPQGVVEWDVDVINQNADSVATYQILTLVERRSWD